MPQFAPGYPERDNGCSLPAGRQVTDGEVSLEEAQEMLSIGKSQVYNLRTKWLALNKSSDFLGVSGGDHTQEWPPECVEHLKIMIEASKPA